MPRALLGLSFFYKRGTPVQGRGNRLSEGVGGLGRAARVLFRLVPLARRVGLRCHLQGGGRTPESQGKNLAFTGLHAPRSLDSGTQTRRKA